MRKDHKIENASITCNTYQQHHRIRTTYNEAHEFEVLQHSMHYFRKFIIIHIKESFYTISRNGHITTPHKVRHIYSSSTSCSVMRVCSRNLHYFLVAYALTAFFTQIIYFVRNFSYTNELAPIYRVRVR